MKDKLLILSFIIRFSSSFRLKGISPTLVIAALGFFTSMVMIPLKSSAQSPQKMSYQSMIRNAAGELVVESPVGIQVSVLQGSVGGTIVFVETHSTTTNVNGLASLEIGTGTIITGTFAGIDWGNGPYFIKTEIDLSGGVSYGMSVMSELLSVPYALHAKTADKVPGLIIEEPLEISLDVVDSTSYDFLYPSQNEGGFVATFENTNTGNGDGIKIKLGKQRTEIAPTVPLTPEELEVAEQIRQLLDGSTPDSEKQAILESLILEGIQGDLETIAGIAVGAGNLITSFINEGIGLPLNVTAPINDALDYDFGLAINDGIGLPADVGLIINDGLGLPWDVTGPINSGLSLPWNVCFPFDIGCFEAVPPFPRFEIPGISEYPKIIGYEYMCVMDGGSTSLNNDFEGEFGSEFYGVGCIVDTDFPNPFIDASNPSSTVLSYKDFGELFALMPFDLATDVFFDLTNNHTFSMKVYIPSSSVTGNQPNDVTLGLENAALGVSTRCSITKPLVLDQWQIVTFDFASDNWVNEDGSSVDPLNRADFNVIVMNFNGEIVNNDAVTAYVDDFNYDGAIPPIPLEDTYEVVPQGTYCEYTNSVAFISQTFTEQATDLRIPGIPANVLKIPTIPDFEIPAIPAIPEVQIGDITITPVDFRDLEFWGIPDFVLTELNDEVLSDENEFIRFSDVDDSKMGSIRALNKADWARNYLNDAFIVKLKNYIRKGVDKRHKIYHIKESTADMIWDYAHLGVEYSSGFGDYAEWLERADPDESMRAGSIVGVVGGKISKDLVNAEQVMVVSHSPIVLGNMPEEGKTHLGNNIAFVGQVPVKVMGPVHTGDYIIGNPATPGYGYAKDPKLISIGEFDLAVGRSWEDRPDEGPKMVNTVVGVHNGDYVNILKAQAQRLEIANDRLGSAESKVESLESNMESVLQILSIEANSK